MRIEQVLEVIDDVAVHAAPGIHPAVRGVTPMRGRMVPLAHLGALIENTPPPPAVGETAVLTRCLGSLLAFEVDDAEAVVMEVPARVPDAWHLPWAAGVARHGEAVVPVIDVDLLGERLTAAGGQESA